MCCKLLMDFVCHAIRWIPMNRDIFLHHMVVTIWLLHYAWSNTLIETEIPHVDWCQTIGLFEVSSIFLSVINLEQYQRGQSRQRMLSTPVSIANQLLFCLTFFYFRVFWFVNVLRGHTTLTEYGELLSTVIHPWYAAVVQSSMYFFGILNLYWSWKIIKMMRRVMCR